MGRAATKGSLYLFDEPTTGLHPDDIQKLVLALHRLVDEGHSVVVVEHNVDVIKCADWVLDLGPGPAEEGGRVVVEGPPETIAQESRQPHGTFFCRLRCVRDTFLLLLASTGSDSLCR